MMAVHLVFSFGDVATCAQMSNQETESLIAPAVTQHLAPTTVCGAARKTVATAASGTTMTTNAVSGGLTLSVLMESPSD